MKFYQLLLENTAINAEPATGVPSGSFSAWFDEHIKTALIGYDAQQTSQVMNTLGGVINKFKKGMLTDILNDPNEASRSGMINDSDTELVYRIDQTPKDGKYPYTGVNNTDIIKRELGIDVDVVDGNPKWKSALDKGYLFWVNIFNINQHWVIDFVHDLIGIYKYATTPTKEITADYVTKIKQIKDPDAQKNAFAELKKSSQNYTKKVQQAAKNLLGALMQVKPGPNETHPFSSEMRGRASWMVGELKEEHENMFKEVLPSMEGTGLEKIYASDSGEVIWKITNRFASIKEGNALRNCIGTFYEFNDEAGAFTTGGRHADPDDYRNMYDIYVLKDREGKTTTAFRMASHADYPILFEIKGYNNHPPDPFHGKTIMNWLNSNDHLEVDEGAKQDLIGGGILQLQDGSWGNYLDRAEFEEITRLKNGDQLTVLTNVKDFEKKMAHKMFALADGQGSAYQIRDPKGAVKFVLHVDDYGTADKKKKARQSDEDAHTDWIHLEGKVLNNIQKPGRGFDEFRHIRTSDVESYTDVLKQIWPILIDKKIVVQMDDDMEETMLAATGNIIDGNQIIPIEAKWPHDLIKEIEGIKISKVTAPTDKMYFDHRYHEMYQGDQSKDDENGYFLLSQNNKILYAVRYEKRVIKKIDRRTDRDVIIPTITAQGSDTDSGLPLEAGVIINPKVRKEVTHAIAWLSKDHHGSEQHTDFPQDPDLIDTEEYWEHYGKNITEVVSGLVSLGPGMTNLKMNRILGQPLNIVLKRWTQLSESMQNRLLDMFTKSDYQITIDFSDKNMKGEPPKTHVGEGWIIIQNGIRFPHNKGTIETFHKTPLKALGTTLGKQLAKQLVEIQKKILTDKRYASFELNDDAGDIEDMLRIVSQGDQSTLELIEQAYKQLKKYYVNIHDQILTIQEQQGWGTNKALGKLIPYMSRRKDNFPVGGLQKLLYQLGPGMPAESREFEMDVKTKWITPTTFTLPNWDNESLAEKIQEHALLTIEKYVSQKEKEDWGPGSAPSNEKRYIKHINPKTGVIDIGNTPMMYFYNYTDDYNNKSQVEKKAKDGLELNAKIEVQGNPKNVEFLKNKDNFDIPYFTQHDDVDPYGHDNFTYEIKVFSYHASNRERFWRDFVQPLEHVLSKNMTLCDSHLRKLNFSKIDSKPE